MTYRPTRRAWRDILAIWVHIAEDHEPAAVPVAGKKIRTRGDSAMICAPVIEVFRWVNI
jgi:plasmid stabilization system protein ParE